MKASSSEDQIVEALVDSVEEDIDSLKVPVRISVGKKALAEHQRIINRLGIYGATDLTPIELEKYLQENGYSVYPLESVTKYMNRKVSELGGKRKKIRRNQWGEETTTTTKWRWVPLRMAQGKDKLFCKQVVPVEVLMTVEKIFNDLGDQVTFEVTEIYRSVRQHPNPNRTPIHGDPFMCVKAGNSRYVLERWDEPGFRA